MSTYLKNTRAAASLLLLVLSLNVVYSVAATEKTPAPSGYSWQSLPDVQGAILKPNGWYYRREEAPDKFAYFLSRESIEKEGKYLAGFAINVFEAFSSRHTIPAFAMAAQHVQGCADRHQPSRVWNIAIDDYRGGGCDFQQQPPGAPLLRLTQVIMADTAEDELYYVTFDMPEAESKEVSEIRDVMLNSLTIRDKRLCMYEYGDERSRQNCAAGDEDIERSLTLRELGALPVNEVSDMFETTSTGISMNYRVEGFLTQQFTFSLLIKPKGELPDGAYLEATFPNPADVSKPLTVVHHWRAGDTGILLQSPAVTELKCRNYKVAVNAYTDSSKSESIGTHRQLIQSRVDLSLVESESDLLGALQSGRCPTEQHRR